MCMGASSLEVFLIPHICYLGKWNVPLEHVIVEIIQAALEELYFYEYIDIIFLYCPNNATVLLQNKLTDIHSAFNYTWTIDLYGLTLVHVFRY